MKYAIYLRVSTDKQDQRTQLDICLNYIRANHTGEFEHHVFTDLISSRKSFDNRPGLQAALSVLQDGDYMIALRIDRVTRNPEEIGDLMRALREKKATLDLAEQPGLASDELMLPIYIALARQEVQLTRKRINNALSSKKARGEMCGKAPYGYSVDPVNLITTRDSSGRWEERAGLLVEDSREQEALVIMQQLFDSNTRYTVICRELTKLGYMNRVGKQFDSSTVAKILKRSGRTRLRVQAPSDRGGCLLPLRK